MMQRDFEPIFNPNRLPGLGWKTITAGLGGGCFRQMRQKVASAQMLSWSLVGVIAPTATSLSVAAILALLLELPNSKRCHPLFTLAKRGGQNRAWRELECQDPALRASCFGEQVW